MIRFLFRFLGLWLAAGAFVALIVDGTRSVSASKLSFASVGDLWSSFDPAGFAGWKQQLGGTFWNRPFELFAASPFWLALGILGLLFLLIGRRRRAERIGYSARD